mmetsp:Transcript_23872/g.35060  ORF Transcript_23872/g.35060 Transcript_23872/m.35060 type:complete len:438 (+) Transcript_23872:123-1436(+)
MDSESEYSNEDDMDGGENFEFQEENFDESPQSKTPITKEDVLRGLDPQGIPWSTLGTSRAEYRKQRLNQYRNYENLDEAQRSEVSASSLQHDVSQHNVKHVDCNNSYYSFEKNERLVPSRIVHFQLRNLVWATTSHDVFVAQAHEILHYNYLTGQLTEILKPMQDKGKLQTGRLQISTMCVHKSVCIAGGFYGDMVCVRCPGEQGGRPEVLFSERITTDENAITNSILAFEPPSGALLAVISNNDCVMRVVDVENHFKEIHRAQFDWPVNFSAVSPDGKLACVVGDSTEAAILDLSSGERIATCDKHLDFSFAAAWHPNGDIFATGNQDKSTRIWDRRTWRCLATLQGRLGAVRSLRFSDDGKYMAMVEPADFIHVFDVNSNFHECQEIDVFGEIAGVSFSPDNDAFFVGIADRTYGAMMQFRKTRKGLLDSSHYFP